MKLIENFLSSDELRSFKLSIDESDWKGMIDTKQYGEEYNFFTKRYETVNVFDEKIQEIIDNLPCKPDSVTIHKLRENDKYEEYRISHNLDEEDYSYYIVVLEGILNVNGKKIKPGELLMFQEKERRKKSFEYKGKSMFIKLVCIR
jgi:hypothetical protein